MMYELIKLENGEIKADSRMVAEHFEKEHYNVLNDIRDEILKLGESTDLIFQVSEYKDSTGRKLPCYEMNEEGLLQIAARYDAVARRKLILMIKELKTKSQLPSMPQEVKDIAEEAKQYYRLPHSEKLNFNRRIKNGLGNDATEKEIADVKDYVFTLLGIEKWEDLPLGQAIQVVDLIDRRCRIIVEERTTLFNWNK